MNTNHPARETDAPWTAHQGDETALRQALARRYPRVTPVLDQLQVTDRIPNLSSIEASLSEWTELPGVRALPFADFGDIDTVFYARDDMDRARVLAREIAAAGWIDPLIVVIDDEGPYLLEGAHRFVALKLIGVSQFPAVVVLDTESLLPEHDRSSEADLTPPIRARGAR